MEHENPAPPPAEEQVKKKKPSLKAEIISWVKVIVSAIVLAFLLKTFVVVNATVVSGSMEKNIMTGDRVICNRIAYLLREPRRFDVIAFDMVEPSGTEVIYVKRIIGLPGETVTVRDGRVYIGDSARPLPDYFVAEPPDETDAGPFEVPEDCYFMMGDNRNSSYDSRYWPDPYVPRADILGKYVFTYYPRLGRLPVVEE